MYYEILQSGQQPSEAKDKAMEEILKQVSQAWLKTNMALFKHVLDYEAKLDKFLNKTGGWIREQEERIWMKMFEISGDAGTPLCTSLNIMLHLLDTLPSFLANLSYQSNSPIICGFAPEAYAQPWLGLHSAWIWHASHLLKNHKKAMDVLKEAIIQSTGGGTVSRVSAGPSALPPPQNPHRSRKTPMHPHSLLPLQSALHPNADAPSPLLHNACSLTPLPTRSQHQGMNPKVVIQAHRVHPDQVLSLAVVVGPVKGPQLDLRPAQARDRPAHDQHQLAASKSFLERRPVEVMMMMMMPCTLPMREMCLKAVCPFLISLSPTMRILANAKHMSLLIKVTPTSRHGKTNSSVMERWVCKEWDNVVNDYADGGKRKPKNPDFFGPPVTYMEERGVFKPLPSTTNPLGLCHFYPVDPMIVSMLTPPKPPAKADHIKGLLLLAKTQPRPYIIVVFKGGSHYSVGTIAGTAYSECTCSYSYLLA